MYKIFYIKQYERKGSRIMIEEGEAFLEWLLKRIDFYYTFFAVGLNNLLFFF